jgi:hypothetical protein
VGIKIALLGLRRIATIVSMIESGSSLAKIAPELGNGLKRNDIKNRWNHHLKD